MCPERRADREFHKLRFRRGGKQVVRYIGNEERAAIVKQELSILQAESRALRELKRKMKTASRVLRESKRIMAPVLEAHGFVFHGLAIRRPRRRQNAMTDNSHP